MAHPLGDTAAWSPPAPIDTPPPPREASPAPPPPATTGSGQERPILSLDEVECDLVEALNASRPKSLHWRTSPSVSAGNGAPGC